MATLVPVDHDPFADTAPVSVGAGSTAGAVVGAPALTVHPQGQQQLVSFTPVDHDPFAEGDSAAAVGQGIINGVPVVGPYLAGGVTNLAAGIRSLQHGTKFDDEKAAVEAFNQNTQQAHPTAETAGNLLGGVASMAPLMAAAPVAFGAGEGALGGRMVLGGLTGSGIGAADSSVRSGGDLGSIATGATVGALGGAAGPAAGALINRVVSGTADEAARALALRKIGLSPGAANALTDALISDGSFGGQGAANIQRVGAGAMLADAGPNAQRVLDTALQHGGTDALAARNAINARALMSARDLNSTLDQTLGKSPGVYSAEKALREGTAIPRRQAYDAAYSTPIDYSSPEGQAVESLFDRIPSSALSHANQLMKVEGHSSQQIMLRELANQPGEYELSHYPDVRQLDYITRSLNDVAKAGDGKGSIGGNTAEGRAYGDLSRDIRKSLRAAVPEYGNALDAAKDPISQAEALEFGSDLLTGKIKRDEAADIISKMSPGQLKYARLAARAHIDDVLAKTHATVTNPDANLNEGMAAYRMLSSRDAQDKISSLVPKSQISPMARALEEVGRDQQMRGALARNSATYARTATDNAIKQAITPGPLGQLAQGEVPKAGKAAVQFLMQTRPQDQLAKEQQVYGELTRALALNNRPGGSADALVLLKRLEDANRTTTNVNQFVDSLPIRRAIQAAALSAAPVYDERNMRPLTIKVK